MNLREYFGEFLGTFCLVLIGCGSVGLAILGVLTSLPQVAAVWGIGVAFAIYLSRAFCPAHLNPAVTLAMVLSKETSWQKLLLYWASQFMGAVFAAIVLFLLFDDALANFELTNGIDRGLFKSRHTALMFGEYFPNPSNSNFIQVSHLLACLMEFLGTFSLVFGIFIIVNTPIHQHMIPLFIGLLVTLLILIVAPYTQAGLNPARDFGPRLVAYFAGWGGAAFPLNKFSALTVYVFSPLFGGACASLLFNRLKK